ncbi:hypothetical protein D3C76_1696160 [compost metagenome]
MKQKRKLSTTTAKHVLKNTRKNRNLELVSSLILHNKYELTYSEKRNETEDATNTDET